MSSRPRMSRKAPKDPNAPKRNLSAYFLFTKERREVLKVQYPDKKLTEYTTIIAAEWNAMDADTKKAFQDRAAVEKQHFAEEMEEYKKTEDFAKHQNKVAVWKEQSKQTALKKAAKKPKDPNAPKKPASAYFLFSARIRHEVAAANPDKKQTEIAKVIGLRWKEMAAADKKQYDDEAARLKEAHKAAVAEYEQSDAFKAYSLSLSEWKQRQNAAKTAAADAGDRSDGAANVERPKVSLPRKPKDSNAPKKPLSSYLLFVNSVRDAVRAENPEMKMTEISKVIGSRWKALSEEEVARWKAMASKEKAVYSAAVETYRGSEHELAFKEKMAEWESECARRQKAADDKFARKMAALSTEAKAAKEAKAEGKKKGGSKHKKSKKKKKRRYSSDSDSSSSFSSDSSSSSSLSSSTDSSSYSSSSSGSSSSYTSDSDSYSD